MRPGVVIVSPRDKNAWLRARGQDVTASVVGALFGVHEYVTSYELYARKTGMVPPDTQETRAMDRGRRLERVAVDLLTDTYPAWTIQHNAAENTYYRDPDARLGATPDVIAHAPSHGKGVIQIKSVEARTYRRKWFPNGPDERPEPPFWIVLQATLEAWLTGADWAAVAPLVISDGIDMPLIDIPLQHMHGIIDRMKERTAEFWDMVKEGRAPDADFGRDAALIEAIYEIGDRFEEVDLTSDNMIPELIAEVAIAQQMEREAADRVKRAMAEIKSKMGSAEVGYIEGGRTITWKTARRSAHTVPASTYRVLRLPTL